MWWTGARYIDPQNESSDSSTRPKAKLRKISGMEMSPPAAQAKRNPCTLWNGARSSNGYGQVNVNGRQRGIHRVVFEGAYGPIAPGHVIHHLCGNRACINPLHMEAMSARQHQRLHNLARGVGVVADLDYCIHGH